MIYSILKTINSVESANYHLKRFLSAFVWSCLILQKVLPAILTLNVLLISSSWKAVSKYFYKTTYFHTHIFISEFVLPLCCRYQFVLSCTCAEYSNDMQFLVTSSYYNSTTNASCESLRNIFLTASHLTIIRHLQIKFLMVGTIFNLAKVNPVHCKFTAISLSQIASTLPDSLAYIESITETTNDIEQVENKKC